jgi:hypothetical protein
MRFEGHLDPLLAIAAEEAADMGLGLGFPDAAGGGDQTGTIEGGRGDHGRCVEVEHDLHGEEQEEQEDQDADDRGEDSLAVLVPQRSYWPICSTWASTFFWVLSTVSLKPPGSLKHLYPERVEGE